jgi:ABC-type Fe3+/spermidine/putrescine transport system ATPase subunit
MTSIEFQHVRKSYGENPVLRDLSLLIKEGERIAIHGPSGCGKSTVLRLLAGFLAPDRGTIRIGNQVVSSDGKIVVPSERRRLAMVFQDLALWPHLTVSGNLEFVLRAQNVSSSERAKRISDMLDRVRLSQFLDVYPQRLSGGQQQRVAIARALIGRPDGLLMDEPLASLDDELREQLCIEILDLHSQLGFTLVYVTHNKDEMRRMGSRAILLTNSKEVPL